MQRIIDIIICLFVFPLVLAIFIPIMIVLKFTGEGEVFFAQERIGKSGEHFMLLKFATMLKNSPNIGTKTVTVQDDPRVLPVGRFLRKSKINELPQIINVLKGDMSIIGPRPQTPRSFDGYPEKLKNIVISVRPGLSGIGSIVFRDEESLLANAESAEMLHHQLLMPYKAELETWYVKHRNLYVYFSLIMITILVVIFPKLDLLRFLFPNIPKPNEKLKKLLSA